MSVSRNLNPLCPASVAALTCVRTGARLHTYHSNLDSLTQKHRLCLHYFCTSAWDQSTKIYARCPISRRTPHRRPRPTRVAGPRCRIPPHPAASAQAGRLRKLTAPRQHRAVESLIVCNSIPPRNAPRSASARFTAGCPGATRNPPVLRRQAATRTFLRPGSPGDRQLYVSEGFYKLNCCWSASSDVAWTQYSANSG